MDSEALRGRTIALSISESPDLGRLGFGLPHLRETALEIARYLLMSGASLAYGGDLRPDGFTRALFEFVRSYRQDAPETLPVSNYLAWPVHKEWTNEQIAELESEFEGGGRLILLDPDGRPLTRKQRVALLTAMSPTDPRQEWAVGLTAMRRTMAHDGSARVLLGGRVKDYYGTAPGLAEEALWILRERKPLYLVGGFGGCTRDITTALGLGFRWRERSLEEIGPGYREILHELRSVWSRNESLNNGLSIEDNSILVEANSAPQIIKIILRGLRGVRTH